MLVPCRVDDARNYSKSTFNFFWLGVLFGVKNHWEKNAKQHNLVGGFNPSEKY